MKVLFVRPKYTSILVNLEPLGLEYLGGMLNGVNIPYEIFDEFNMMSLFCFTRLSHKIKSQAFTHIGFHVNANSVDYCLKTAKRLKRKFPYLKILMGGPHVELNYNDFCIDEVDYVCYDNGLESLEKCYRGNFKMEVLQNANGIAYKDSSVKWVFREKSPAICRYHVKPDRSEFYKGLKRNFILCKGSYAIVRGSFSCPYDCSFCYCTRMNSGQYAERNLEELLQEISEIQHKNIWIMDDDFLINTERVRDFCNKMIDAALNKKLMIYGRADSIVRNKELMPLLYQAGVRDIMVGLEAVTDKLLEDYNKETTRNINKEATEILRENNIVCNGLFVISHDSTRQYFKELIYFIRKQKLLWVVFGIFTPYKGTAAYEQYKELVKHLPSKKMDGAHVTIKPVHMGSLEFKLRFYLLHLLFYPKLFIRSWMKSAYDTKNSGWF